MSERDARERKGGREVERKGERGMERKEGERGGEVCTS
jgi:hypothetical protein